MKKDLRESAPKIAPNQEKLEQLKDFLKTYIAEEVITSGAFNQTVVEKKIIEAIPTIDETMLGVRLPIFQEEIKHYAVDLKSLRNKTEIFSAIAQKVDSSLNFLLS